MPRYQEIFLELAERIRSGAYLSGTLLPGEHRLMEEFGVSRDTVRKALSLLSRFGYIEKSRGRGSTVINPASSITVSGSMGFTEYAAQNGYSARTDVLQIGSVLPEPGIREILGISAETPVYRIDRIRWQNGVPFAAETDYLNGSLLTCPSREAAAGSLYGFMEKTCGQKITGVRRKTSGIKASAADAESLHLPEGSVLIQVTSSAVNKSGSILLYSISRYSPELYVYEEFLQRSLKL